MIKDHITILVALSEETRPDGEMCVGFDALCRNSSLDRKRVRFVCRHLKRLGLAEFHNALWNDDGKPAGAGYCISREGLERLK